MYGMVIVGYILIIVLILVVGIVMGFYLIQDILIFRGERLPVSHEYTFDTAFEELNYERKDGGIINCLLFRADNSKGLVYYHHGNAGNIQDWGKLNAIFLENHFDILFYDYRGFGKSTGSIKKESELHTDAKFVLDEYSKSHSYENLILYGTSLGSGVAANLACKVNPQVLILETPYYSFSQLINFHYPFLPANLLSKYKLRTNKRLKKLECPVTLIHGTDDEIVPFSCSVRLSEMSENITLVKIKGGAHNNLPDYELYQETLKSLLHQLWVK